MQRIRFLSLLLLASAILIAGCTSASPPRSTQTAPATTPPGASPTLNIYLGSQDGSVTALNASSGSVRWTYTIAGATETRPVAVLDGTVFINASDSQNYASPAHSFLYALNAADGSVKWHRQTAGVENMQTVQQGVVYVTSDFAHNAAKQNQIYALRVQDGTLLWKSATDGTGSMQVVADDGALYVVSSDGQEGPSAGYLYRLSASDGSVQWHTKTGLPNASALSVANGLFYLEEGVDGPNAILFALNTHDGSTRWQFPRAQETGTIGAGILVGEANGITYVQASIGDPTQLAFHLQALRDSDGSVVWSQAIHGITSHAVLVNGVIYVETAQGTVNALRTKDGSTLWKTQVDPASQAKGGWIVSIKTGVVYAFVATTALYALDATTGKQQWSYQANFETASVLAVEHNTLYALLRNSPDASTPDQVIALNTGNAALQWQHNAGTEGGAPIAG